MDGDKYPRPWQPGDQTTAPSTIRQKFDELAELADAVGIDLGPAFATGREKLGHAGQFIAAYRERREDRTDASLRIARQIVDGTLDLEGAAREAVVVESMKHGSILAAAVNTTKSLAAREALTGTGHDLDGDRILDDCRTVVAETISEIRGLRKILDGIRDAEQATRAGPKTASAWARYRTELLPRWENTHQLVKALRELHWIAPLPVTLAAYARHGRVDLAREDTAAAKRARRDLLVLLDAECDRWETGGPHTELEARAFDRALDEVLGPRQTVQVG